MYIICMSSTSLSLLQQAQQRLPGAWDRFQGVYEPLLRYWVMRDSLARLEADDLVQDLMLKLYQELPEFTRQRPGSFRKWLRVLATNRVREFLRKKRPQAATETLFDQLANPNNELLESWNREYARCVTAKLVALVQTEFSTLAWSLFSETEFLQRSIRDVAQAHGVSVAEVYRTRHQLMTRLRQLGEELLEHEKS